MYLLTKTLPVLQQNYLLVNEEAGSCILLGFPSTSGSATKHS